VVNTFAAATSSAISPSPEVTAVVAAVAVEVDVVVVDAEAAVVEVEGEEVAGAEVVCRLVLEAAAADERRLREPSCLFTMSVRRLTQTS
jgi:hypothetical protein